MDMMQLAILMGGVFLTLACMVFAFSGPDTGKAQSRRLDGIKDRHTPGAAATIETQLRKVNAARSKTLESLAQRFIPNPALLRFRLEQTGKGWTLGSYMGVCVIMALVVCSAMLVLAMPLYLAVPVGLAAGFGVPHFAVGFLIKRRIGKFTNNFPDAIELMVRGLRSGLPISETLTIVASEISGPIGEEFKTVCDKIRIGKSMEQALQDTADRLGTPEVQFFCITLAIQRETGGNSARTHFLRQKLQDSSIMLSFAAKIAQVYKPESIKAIERRNKDTEIINYKGNVNCATKDSLTNSKITFWALDVDDLFILDSVTLKERIEGKVIIMGYMGPDFRTYSTEDRFFTPLNANYVGKADPDMYGVIVHANIVSMILSENYINEMPDGQVDIINYIIICLNIILFLYLYGKLEQFWDGATLLITIFQALLFLTIIVYIFNMLNYKLNFTLAIVALFLMPNVIELYFGIVKTTLNKIIEKINHRNTKRKIIVKPEE